MPSFLAKYLELEGAQWLYLKLFRSTIESTTKGGRIYVSYRASERRKWMRGRGEENNEIMM